MSIKQQNEINELRAQLAELAKRVEALESKKRGRPSGQKAQ
jgi:uncharacterized coiled-coil protein SlyX